MTAQTTVSSSGYMTLDLHYNDLILPLDKMAELLALLQHAEKWDNSEYNNPRIVPIPINGITAGYVPKTEYLRIKTLELLDPQTP